MADLFNKKTRSKIMASIKSRNTEIEISFRKELYRQGLRGFRINNRNIYGTPDVVYPKYKLAIFIDGDFWHGYDWKAKGRVPPKEYWQEKIQKNIDRDNRVTSELQTQGWTVLRFWEHEIRNNLEGCTSRVKDVLCAENQKTCY